MLKIWLVVGFLGLAFFANASEKSAENMKKMVECKRMWPEKLTKDYYQVTAYLKTHVKFDTCDWNNDTVACKLDGEDRKIKNLKVDKQCMKDSKENKGLQLSKCIIVAYSPYYTTSDGNVVCREIPGNDETRKEESAIKVER